MTWVTSLIEHAAYIY